MKTTSTSTSTYNICIVSAKQQLVGDKFFVFCQKYREKIIKTEKNIAIFLSKLKKISKILCENKNLNMSHNGVKYIQGLVVKTIG